MLRTLIDTKLRYTLRYFRHRYKSVAKGCYTIATVLVSFVYNSCRYVPTDVDDVLSSAPLSSRIELQSVINHYRESGEQQKLNAAFYLIKNLPAQRHIAGEGFTNYKALFPLLLKADQQRKLRYDLVWDSLSKVSNISFPGNFDYQGDSQTVTAQLLIHHIDAAFRAWKYPWAASLTFNEFCEYILPYKLVDEEPEEWMRQIQDKNSWLVESMKGSEDPYKACVKVNQHLKDKFVINSLPTYWDVNYSQLDSASVGKCYHATQYTSYTMRALGIPVVMDYTISWGNMNGGHHWNAIIFKGKPIPFVGCESNPGKTKIDLALQRKRAKVFRYTYEPQPRSLAILNNDEEEIPAYFSSSRIMDVTDQYIPVTDIHLALAPTSKIFKFVYLCVFNRQRWIPVYWSEKTNLNEANFTKMGRDIVYLPAYYQKDHLMPAGKPFLITRGGRVKELSSKASKSMLISVDKKGPQGPSIRQGSVYEVYRWNGQWVLTDKLTAKNKKVIIKADSCGLYWIHNSDKPTKERIFTYSQNKITWW